MPSPPGHASGQSRFPAESRAIEARRNTYGHTEGGSVGIALSGGGIRSATFGLGMLRALSSLRLLQKVDYVSTVSGGGYVGAFYCGLFAGRGPEVPAVLVPPADPTEAGNTDLLADATARQAIRYLRQSGRYLTPSGARDYVYASALILRNWFALTLVTGLFLLSLFLAMDAARQVLLWCHVVVWDHLWISPATILLFLAGFAAFGVGWSYWLTVRDVSAGALRPPLVGTALIVLVGAFVLAGPWPDLSLQTSKSGIPLPSAALARWFIGWTIVAAGACATVAWLWAVHRAGDVRPEAEAHERAAREDRIRHRLTKWQAAAALATAAAALVVLVDMASWGVVWLGKSVVLPGIGLPAVLVPAARSLIRRLATLSPSASGAVGARPPASMLSRYGTVFAWGAAILLGVVALLFWGALAHLLSFPGWWWNTGGDQAAGGWLWSALLASLALTGLACSSDEFVNLSSLSTFYAARLRRAYLGAGNRRRIGADGPVRMVDESVSGDDLGLAQYYEGSRAGAPVHLVNITINQTRGKGPNTVQRDRHGLNMVISPDGMIYSETADDAVKIKPLGLSHAAQAAWAGATNGGAPPSDPPGPGQSLPLSSWIGISGAAFSTGLGSRTNLAFSLLAFLANVRLGFWWKSTRSGRRRPTVYCNLFNELAAAFPGTDNDEWYLSDGGHFENTGVYELVRRRVSFIVASDNGYDASYGFEDLANLVRKCRIDFGAEIEVLNAEELSAQIEDKGMRALFAAPAEFGRRDAAPKGIAMLATITYDDGERATLVIVKPRLTEDGPADLMRYFAENGSFPQQTTFDQFFDEAQWESYYELGRRMTLDLFRHRTGSTWQPFCLRNRFDPVSSARTTCLAGVQATESRVEQPRSAVADAPTNG